MSRRHNRSTRPPTMPAWFVDGDRNITVSRLETFWTWRRISLPPLIPGWVRSIGAIVRPISVDTIPAAARGDAVIRSCDPNEPWFLTARRIVPIGERAARVELRGAAIAAYQPRVLGRTALRGREPVVLGVPSGTEDLDGCVFPVHGLSATHAVVEATFPLDPGRTFDPVELIGNRRILRRAAATVLEVIPWIEHDGSRRFRCRVQLESSDGPPDGEAYDLLSHPGRIRKLLDLACMLTTAG